MKIIERQTETKVEVRFHVRQCVNSCSPFLISTVIIHITLKGNYLRYQLTTNRSIRLPNITLGNIELYANVLDKLFWCQAFSFKE